MRAFYLVPLFVLPSLHAAKKSAPALEQPKAVRKAKAAKKTPFNAFRDDSFVFRERQTGAFDNVSANNRPAQFPEEYNPWNENATLNNEAFND